MKKKSNAGFTLAETLLAILILMLASMIVANGMPAARSAYEKVVIGANAKVLLSTTISALRDELSTARNVIVDSTEKSIEYYSADDGATSKILLKDNTIKLQEYCDDSPIAKGTKLWNVDENERALVTQKAATADLIVVFETVDQNAEGNAVEFTGLKVCRKSNLDKALASVDTLTIRLIQPIPIPQA